MNAGGVLNTCKSNEPIPLQRTEDSSEVQSAGEVSGDRVSNT
jgi:hypothetical protein